MLDAIEVLKWVKQNIVAFGGDANQVTVAGQSAGSAMCHVLLTSPLSKGLIHGAILQSGAGRGFREPSTANGPLSYRTMLQAEREGTDLMNELGLNSVAEFREYKDVDHMVKISTRRDHSLWGPPPMWRLIQDGYVIPRSWSEIMQDGPSNDVPVMTGMNSDEGGTYNEPRFTIEDFHECVESRFGPSSAYGKGTGETVKKFLALYPPSDKDMGKGPIDAWNAACRDNTRNNIMHWAQSYSQTTQSPVYGYYYTHHITPWEHWQPDQSAGKVPGFTNMKGVMSGAYHGAEFPYTFNSLVSNNIRPWTVLDREVGEKMSTIWANFIKYGNPNGIEHPNGMPSGVQRWPSLNEEPDKLLELGTTWKVINTVDCKERKAFWDGYLKEQKAW